MSLRNDRQLLKDLKRKYQKRKRHSRNEDVWINRNVDLLRLNNRDVPNGLSVEK
jgi:hypothetical protein